MIWPLENPWYCIFTYTIFNGKTSTIHVGNLYHTVEPMGPINGNPLEPSLGFCPGERAAMGGPEVPCALGRGMLTALL